MGEEAKVNAIQHLQVVRVQLFSLCIEIIRYNQHHKSTRKLIRNLVNIDYYQMHE